MYIKQLGRRWFNVLCAESKAAYRVKNSECALHFRSPWELHRLWCGDCLVTKMDLLGLPASRKGDALVAIHNFSSTGCLLLTAEKFHFQAAEDSNTWLTHMIQFAIFFWSILSFLMCLWDSHISKLKHQSFTGLIPLVCPPLHTLCRWRGGRSALAPLHSQIWPWCRELTQHLFLVQRGRSLLYTTCGTSF